MDRLAKKAMVIDGQKLELGHCPASPHALASLGVWRSGHTFDSRMPVRGTVIATNPHVQYLHAFIGANNAKPKQRQEAGNCEAPACSP